MAIVRAAIAGVSARTTVNRALQQQTFPTLFAHPLHVIAAGKAASAMITALAMRPDIPARTLLAIGTHPEPDMPSTVEWHQCAHPLPDDRSVTAGARALAVAHAVGRDEALLILLSGGASSLMALPVEDLSLAEKQQAIRQMLLAGADIHALNTVRKHLSRIKGGRLAAACPGTTVTLAISDVVGDDLSVIGSGPGVADPPTWRDVARVVEHFGEPSDAIRRVVAKGVAGEIADTPKPGDASLSRAGAHVIASRRHALDAARRAANALGYDVHLLEGDVVGEARDIAPQWLDRVRPVVRAARRPTCILSAGETTVRVVGNGRGGRNQEFALALTDAVDTPAHDIIVASVGTDGIDGPTDAAGALVDNTTGDRAMALQLDARRSLGNNDAYNYFAALGDLIHLGPTDTNVGDLQVVLAAPR
jgi:hydroxypyruvate reductase